MWPPPPLDARLAMKADAAAKKLKRRNKAPEADLQKAVAAYLRLALPRSSGIFWSATMNGTRLPTEAARRRAKEQGLNAGVPDLVFIVIRPVPGLSVGDTYWLELKAPQGGALTPEQKEIITHALYPHGRGAVARSIEQVEAALTAWGFPIRARI